MKFGISINNCREGSYVPSGFSSPQQIVKLVKLADKLGFDSVWGNDHISAVPAVRNKYPTPPNIYESIVTMTFLAGVTGRMQLGIGNIAMPLRDPVLLAKQVATLDVFSGGRFLLGVGLGSQREEFQAVRPDMQNAHRGKLLEEQYESLYLLLTKEEASYKGEYVRFEGVSIQPKAIQSPPPIYITGEIAENAARVAKWGTGWSNNRLREQLSISQRWEMLRPLLEKQGRSESEIDMHTEATLFLASTHEKAAERFRNGWMGVDSERVIERGMIGTPQEIVEKIGVMQRQGLTHFLAIPGQIRTYDEWVEQVQMFGEEVLPAFRKGSQ